MDLGPLGGLRAEAMSSPGPRPSSRNPSLARKRINRFLGSFLNSVSRHLPPWQGWAGGGWILGKSRQLWAPVPSEGTVLRKVAGR